MIALGVAISIPIMIFGSKAIVIAMDKFSWIAYVGAGILAWTAGEMILKEKFVTDILHISHGPLQYLVLALLTVVLLGIGYLKNKKSAAKSNAKHAA